MVRKSTPKFNVDKERWSDDVIRRKIISSRVSDKEQGIEALKLLRDTDLTPNQITTKTGVPYGTIHSWEKRIRQFIEEEGTNIDEEVEKISENESNAFEKLGRELRTAIGDTNTSEQLDAPSKPICIQETIDASSLDFLISKKDITIDDIKHMLIPVLNGFSYLGDSKMEFIFQLNLVEDKE